MIVPSFSSPNSMRNTPAMMVAMMPFSGVTPEAIPNAMASGSATMPTMMPAMRSDMKFFLLYDFSVSNNWGFKSNVFIRIN